MKTIGHCLTSPPCRVLGLSLEKVLSEDYDLILVSIGYEKRSRFFSENYNLTARARVAVAFTDRNTLSFIDNMAYFGASQFRIEPKAAYDFGGAISNEISQLIQRGNERIKICVDISSMSRSRMAAIVESASSLSSSCTIQVDFVYCAAKYSPPPDVSASIESAAPVNSFFAGWSTSPDIPTCAIFGVGYEPDAVIGSIEYLEPGSVWAFVPEGPDPRFLEQVMKVNESLWNDISSEYVVPYRLSEPFNTFVHLESLIYSTKQHYRTILVPFGPKLFTIQCLLAACVHYPDVSVWRVSGGESARPEDREGSGEVFAIRSEFETSIEQ